MAAFRKLVGGVVLAAPTPDKAQDLAGLRVLMSVPQDQVSATLTARVRDDTYDSRTNGTVNLTDVQTGSLSTTALDGGALTMAYVTLTPDAAYRRTEEGPWTRTARTSEPLVADHRPLVRALLDADPASYLGTVRLRGRNGGQGHHLAGKLPVATVRETVGARMFQRLTDHGVTECATDVRVDTRGRLSELALDCTAGGYRFQSQTGLSEFGPVNAPEAPTDQ